MNKRSKFLPFILVIFCALLGLFLLKEDRIEISDIKKNCSPFPCEISFSIENNSNKYIQCKISIRGIRQSGSKTPSVDDSSGIAGEKTIEMELYPKEKRAVIERVEMKGAIRKIQVTSWNIQELD